VLIQLVNKNYGSACPTKKSHENRLAGSEPLKAQPGERSVHESSQKETGNKEGSEAKPTVSFPPGVPRMFENLVPAVDEEEGLLLAIVGGEAPISEAMPGVMQLLMQTSKSDLSMLQTGAADMKQPGNAGGDHGGKSILITTNSGGFGGDPPEDSPASPIGEALRQNGSCCG
jgi:hypothetical protein